MPNNEASEQSVEQSILGLGGIPEVEMEVSVSGMTQYPVDKTLAIEDMAADAKATGEAIGTLQADIADIETEIQGITKVAYPVGSIYMTVSEEPPEFPGVWVEIGITATWSQLKTGLRNYTELEEGQTGGSVHFWLRLPDEE